MRLFVQIILKTIFRTFSLLFPLVTTPFWTTCTFCRSLLIYVSCFIRHPLEQSAFLVLKSFASIPDTSCFCMCSKTLLLEDFFSANLSRVAAKHFSGSARTSVSIWLNVGPMSLIFLFFSFLLLFFFNFILLCSQDEAVILAFSKSK